MRILIADDQRDVGRALAGLVRLCNHEVVEVVGSGLDAIQAYNRHRPDLVLMDHRMPKLNGVTACRNIVSKDPTARVILVTAWSPSDDASASGAVAILPKPVDLQRLGATLQSIAATLPPVFSDLPTFNFDLPFGSSDPPSPNFHLLSSISDLPAPNYQLPSPISDLSPPNSDLPAPNFQFVDLPFVSSDLPAPSFHFVDLPSPAPELKVVPVVTGNGSAGRTSPARGKNSRNNHRRREKRIRVR